MKHEVGASGRDATGAGQARSAGAAIWALCCSVKLTKDQMMAAHSRNTLSFSYRIKTVSRARPTVQTAAYRA
jgi:hypothetical protein